MVISPPLFTTLSSLPVKSLLVCLNGLYTQGLLTKTFHFVSIKSIWKKLLFFFKLPVVRVTSRTAHCLIKVFTATLLFRLVYFEE